MRDKPAMETLLKAASLCREAAEKLRASESPEKMASEVTNTMISKGMISPAERERYVSFMTQFPEKIATYKESVASLPARVGAIGEVSTTSYDRSELDSMDKFMHS